MKYIIHLILIFAALVSCNHNSDDNKQDLTNSGLPESEMMYLSQKPDTRVEGVWQLVEYHDWNPDGTEIESLGNQAPGIFVYTPEGNLSLHIMTQFDRPLVNSETSNEELGEIYRPYIGYFGTYSVDYEAMTITHNIEGAKLPNRIGRAAIRTFYFDDGDLVLDFTNSEGWRFYRRLKRVETLKGEN